MAVVYVEIADWIQRQKVKPILTPEDVLDCMWYQVHGDHMTRYAILCGEIAIPDNLPDDMQARIKAALKEFTSG